MLFGPFILRYIAVKDEIQKVEYRKATHRDHLSLLLGLHYFSLALLAMMTCVGNTEIPTNTNNHHGGMGISQSGNIYSN